MSAEDRANLCLSLAMVCSYLAAYLPCFERVSACFASAGAVNKQRVVARNRAGQTSSQVISTQNDLVAAHNAGGIDDNLSVSSGISVSELLSDFECDGSNRLSDFSFESRFDSLF